jgi:hypothetical protein
VLRSLVLFGSGLAGRLGTSWKGIGVASLAIVDFGVVGVCLRRSV